MPLVSGKMSVALKILGKVVLENVTAPPRYLAELGDQVKLEPFPRSLRGRKRITGQQLRKREIFEGGSALCNRTCITYCESDLARAIAVHPMRWPLKIRQIVPILEADHLQHGPVRMKRRERLRKLWAWNAAGFATFAGLLIPVASASMIQTANDSAQFPGLAKFAAKFPTAQFWDWLLPTGYLGTMPMRMVAVFVIALALAGMVAISQKHARMLRKEDEARELRDI
jgi:hypothetical protein